MEGEYVSQVFIGCECLAPEYGNGTTAVIPGKAAAQATFAEEGGRFRAPHT